MVAESNDHEVHAALAKLRAALQAVQKVAARPRQIAPGAKVLGALWRGHLSTALAEMMTTGWAKEKGEDIDGSGADPEWLAGQFADLVIAAPSSERSKWNRSIALFGVLAHDNTPPKLVEHWKTMSIPEVLELETERIAAACRRLLKKRAA
jgi:hypothetical protein